MMKTNRRHIRLISWHWTRYAVRSGAGLVYLMMALVFGLSVAQIVLTPVEQTMAADARAGQESSYEETVGQIVEFGRPVIRWVLGVVSEEGNADGDEAVMMGYGMGPMQSPRDPWTTYLLDDQPGLLSVVFVVLVFGMPFLISFLAFNQIAGDVQSLGLRYLLLRTERSSIFFGRFLGTALFSTVVIAVIIATITFYIGITLKIYSAWSLLAWGLYGFAALSILMLPYIAVCSLVSALVDSSFVSLVVAKLVICGVLLFAVLGSLAWDQAIYVKFALPWGIQNYLLHPEVTHSVGAALACLGYTAVFLFLGYRRFESRDL